MMAKSKFGLFQSVFFFLGGQNHHKFEGVVLRKYISWKESPIK